MHMLVDEAWGQDTILRVDLLDIKPAVLARQALPNPDYLSEADKHVFPPQRLRRENFCVSNQKHNCAAPLQ